MSTTEMPVPPAPATAGLPDGVPAPPGTGAAAWRRSGAAAAAVTAPALTVEVDGGALDAAALGRLTAVRVAERLSCPAQCELVFAGFAEAATCPVGAPLTVRLATDDGPLFRGEITAVAHVVGPDGLGELEVRAYDVLHRLRKRQSVRLFEGVSIHDLAGQLVGGLGLSVTGADGPRRSRLVQHRQDDLALLDEVAAAAGLGFAVRGDELRLLTRAGDGDPVELTVGSTLVEARVERNDDPACRSVTVRGWHAGDAAPVEGRSGDARVAFTVDDGTGPERSGGAGTRVLADAAVSTADEAAARAQAELDARVARELVLDAVAAGDARLRVGVPVTVAGLPGPAEGGVPGLAGPHVPTAVTHTVDAAGYLTHLSSAPPPARPAPPGPTVTLAEVTAVDDPDGRGRVRVALPAYGDLASDWLGVVVPGAGAGRGLVALPDVGDRVLVVLPQADPAAGVVLGGVYGTGGPPDPGVVDGAVARFALRTAGGQAVVLDDEGRRVVVREQGGSTVELGPERALVHARTDLTIEAPGRTLTIRAKRVDFVEAAEPEDGPSLPGPAGGPS